MTADMSISNMPGGDLNGSFGDLAVNMGNRIYPDISHLVGASEETLGEIDMERITYLLSADDMLEEMLHKKE